MSVDQNGKSQRAQGFEFSDQTWVEAHLRQNGRCACCGKSLNEDLVEAHHGIPERIADPRVPEDAFFRSTDNCLLLHKSCHEDAHDDRYREGPVDLPRRFRYSHGGDAKEHRAWCGRVEAQWQRKLREKNSGPSPAQETPSPTRQPPADKSPQVGRAYQLGDFRRSGQQAGPTRDAVSALPPPAERGSESPRKDAGSAVPAPVRGTTASEPDVARRQKLQEKLRRRAQGGRSMSKREE